MNVSCPSCGAQFRVNDAHLAAGPRKVRCGKCAHVWAVSRQSAAPPRARQRPAPAPAAPGPSMTPPPPPPPQASPASAPKAPARAERRGGGLWIWWLLLLVVIAALAAGGWFGRGWLVEQWPPATRFYDWVGIDLPRIEIVSRTEEAIGEGGTRRLTVGGTIANHADTALPVPPLLFTLYDAGGAPINQWLERPPVTTLGPGETVPFTSSVAISSEEGGAPPHWDVVLQRDAVEDVDAPDGSDGAASHEAPAGTDHGEAAETPPADEGSGEAGGDGH